MAVDPVCGIHVEEAAAQPTEEFTTDYEGQKFYFCSEDCKQVFEECLPNTHRSPELFRAAFTNRRHGMPWALLAPEVR